MSAQPAPFNREIAGRFVAAVRDLLTSEVRGKAIRMLVLLLVFALSVNGLNVVNSYVGRDFMTAIADRDMAGFVKFAALYVGVFAATTAVAVLYRFTEERLGLLWRSWLTRRVATRYLERHTYLHLKGSVEVDNPDQRITEDVRAFTVTTLSFTLILLNAVLAVVSFSGVLWTISPLLFGVAVGYAALGSLLTVLLGRRLIGLNYTQSGREADFRAALIHVRENAESVALSRGEARLTERLGEPDRRAGAELPAHHVGESQSGLFHDRVQLLDPDHSRAVGCAAIHTRRGRVRRDYAVRDGFRTVARRVFGDRQSVRIDLRVRRGHCSAQRVR